MGGKLTRTIISCTTSFAGVALAPVTGGLSLIGTGYGVLRFAEEGAVSSTFDSIVNCQISSDSQLWEKKIQSIEMRWCQLTNKGKDAATTFLARVSMMTTRAAHHHFIIVTLESGDCVYFDKHSHRNILVVYNTDGFNQNNEWVPSNLMRGGTATKGKTLKELYNYATLDKFMLYHTLDSNCQHFADALYDYIK
ncbi:hypothetical protein CYY_006567 [Polysphondylium violaceum]|uniref:Uncharacterized protein n=1 Tax=Polysphondylium violaceum TaxID=133409 RepID=A0A8J4V309_9MYCE|nr:hypothetical protein CYY_006567 [Polysphondylium violaceum]